MIKKNQRNKIALNCMERIWNTYASSIFTVIKLSILIVLSSTISLSAQSVYCYNLLIEACSKGDIDKAKHLTSNGYDVNLQCDKTGLTPLIVASINEKTELARWLLEKGASPHMGDKAGITALSYALSNQHACIIKLLLKNGAQLNTLDKQNMTPLMYASALNKKDYAKLLIDHGAHVYNKSPRGYNPMDVALSNNYIDIVKLLIEYGHPIDAKLIEGYTPLHLAIVNGDVNIISYLLAMGADYRILNEHGHNAAELAICLKRKDVVEVLFRHASKKGDISYSIDTINSFSAKSAQGIENIEFFRPKVKKNR